MRAIWKLILKLNKKLILKHLTTLYQNDAWPLARREEERWRALWQQRPPLRTRGRKSSNTSQSFRPSFLLPLPTPPPPSASSITVISVSSSARSLSCHLFNSLFLFFIVYYSIPSCNSVVSDDVPLVVSRQLLQIFAQELGNLDPDVQKEISHYSLARIQPRVVSFEEQVLSLTKKSRP